MQYIKKIFIIGILVAALPFIASAAGNPYPFAPNSGSGSNTSFNWSGYVAEGGPFASVAGTWTVPTVASTNHLTADATWVGIGGSTTHNLIQAGTQAITQDDGSISYEAWYETLPETTQPIGVTVTGGDSVTAIVTQTSRGDWEVTFTNNTTGQTASVNLQYDSSLSSAEWIEEMPTDGTRLIPLDDFGTTSFTNGSAVMNGNAVTIASSGAQPLTMVNQGGQTLAVPSTLGADGASFTISREDTTSSVSIASRTYPVLKRSRYQVVVSSVTTDPQEAQFLQILQQFQSLFSQFGMNQFSLLRQAR